MLINGNIIINILKSSNILITGSFHIGAHECEEISFYNSLGLELKDMIWIEALNNKVIELNNRNIPNVYNAVISDKDNEEIIFNIANNGQSSSILEFGTHSIEHPWVTYIDKIKMNTITIDTFIKNNNIDISKYNFWNFDIQGAELLALKGAHNVLNTAKVLYLEVNKNELYKGCGLINEIDEFLSHFNFKRVYTEMTSHGWGDALYIK